MFWNLSRLKNMHQDMDGVLVIDKPAGPTSHDVVAIVKRIARARKVGHLGTLDPAASGVLPLVINKATKFASELAQGGKLYEFTLCLGQLTDTDDDAGAVLTSREVSPSLEKTLPGILGEFIGSIMQRPPLFSAKKLGGRRACDLARKGVTFSLEPRPVLIESLELTGGEWPRPRLRMACGPGTYVRSICRDIAERLGVPGHASGIRRLKSGPYIIDDSVSLDLLAAEPELWRERIIPL